MGELSAQMRLGNGQISSSLSLDQQAKPHRTQGHLHQKYGQWGGGVMVMGVMVVGVMAISNELLGNQLPLVHQEAKVWVLSSNFQICIEQLLLSDGWVVNVWCKGKARLEKKQ